VSNPKPLELSIAVTEDLETHAIIGAVVLWGDESRHCFGVQTLGPHDGWPVYWAKDKDGRIFWSEQADAGVAPAPRKSYWVVGNGLKV